MSSEHDRDILSKGRAVRFRQRRLFGVAVGVLFLVAPHHLLAAEDIAVQVRPGQTIQDIATEYLGDASLWPTILERNGLARPDQIVPWMQLRIPATGLATAMMTINRAQTELGRATKAGGRLFAGSLLDQSKRNLDAARDALKRQDYFQARQSADAALRLAQQARRAATSASNVAVQAVLGKLRGTVETQRPDELSWRRAEPRMRLIEGERIRTRSGSSAEIIFRDNSKLRLSANSLAVIKEMRQDLLRKTNRSSVALLQGDVLAYLAELRENNRFDLQLPDMKTYVQSRSFWVNRDAHQTSRLAVYEGQISVVAAGDSVVVRQNEGTTIRPNRPPEKPRVLLAAPVVRSPEDNRTFYNEYPRLRWSPVADARAYRLEIAQDRRFLQVATLLPKLRARAFSPRRLTRGIYYWRVSAVDSLGFPGPSSAPRRFVMQFDKIPPFIVVKYPRRLVSFTNEPLIAISGETEKGATLTINGKPVEALEGDRFQHLASLADGENRFSIAVKDSGGNETTVIRRIVRQENAPDVEVLGIESDELSFITNTPFFTMNGQTETGARMTLWRLNDGHPTDSLAVPVRSDGNFTFTVPLDSPGTGDFLLEAVDRAGNRRNKQIRIAFDNAPPELTVDSPSYLVTRADSVRLKGRVERGSVLLINRQAVPVDSGRFSEAFPLAAGRQFFTLVAEDDAGNKTVARSIVVHDAAPPRLVNWSLTPVRVKGGEAVTVAVRARDKIVGLRRTARYRVAGPGSFVREGFLVSRGPRGEFTARFLVPPGVRGRLRLEWVQLADILGNKRDYSPPPRSRRRRR